MNFYWAWKSFLGVKLFTHHFREHFVNPNISQENIIVFQQLTFVFELSEISFKSVKTNDFSNARDIHIFNLLSEFRLRVLNDQTNASVK